MCADLSAPILVGTAQFVERNVAPEEATEPLLMLEQMARGAAEDAGAGDALLGKLGAPAYTAAQYASDCGSLPITKTVHVEAIADDGLGEAPAAVWGGSFQASLVQEHTGQSSVHIRCPFHSIHGEGRKKEGLVCVTVTSCLAYMCGFK